MVLNRHHVRAAAGRKRRNNSTARPQRRAPQPARRSNSFSPPCPRSGETKAYLSAATEGSPEGDQPVAVVEPGRGARPNRSPDISAGAAPVGSAAAARGLFFLSRNRIFVLFFLSPNRFFVLRPQRSGADLRLMARCSLLTRLLIRCCRGRRRDRCRGSNPRCAGWRGCTWRGGGHAFGAFAMRKVRIEAGGMRSQERVP